MIRVLLVDDEELVRMGLRMILRNADDVEVVGEGRDGAEAVELARDLRPDLVLLDIRMPGTDGLDAAELLVALPQPPAVVVLTTFSMDEYVHRALRIGARGFLLKDTPARELINAVRTIHNGDALLAPSVTRRLLQKFAAVPDSTTAARRLDVLSERERLVLVAVARGMSNAEAGHALSMQEGTVKAHVSRILGKLGMNNRVQAAILAHEAGWV